MALNQGGRGDEEEEEDSKLYWICDLCDKVNLKSIKPFRVQWISHNGRHVINNQFCDNKCYKNSPYRKQLLDKYFVYFLNDPKTNK